MNPRIDGFPANLPLERYVEYLETLICHTRYTEAVAASGILTLSSPQSLIGCGTTFGPTSVTTHNSDPLSHVRATEDIVRCASSLKRPTFDPIFYSSEAPPRKRATPAQWRSGVLTLARDIADHDAWQQRMCDSGLREMLITIKVRSQILITCYQHEITQEHLRANSLLHPGTRRLKVESLFDYAEQASKQVTIVKCDLMVVLFRIVVIVSASILLLDDKRYSIPIEAVHQVVRRALGVDCTDDYCHRVIRAVRWINRLIDAMDAAGWNGAAATIILLCQAMFCINTEDPVLT
ncbi:hypothetical protein ANO11243_056580 [Dothideomycetidae sp. 11243]|nr:hypothetical protein ANO11243_056580 [fungal sp. No.11243]